MVVNNVHSQQVEEVMDCTSLESLGEPPLQELSLQEQQETKQRWNTQNRNKTKKPNQGKSSGMDLEAGSWESIILETPRGVQKEYIVKSCTNSMLIIPNQE